MNKHILFPLVLLLASCSTPANKTEVSVKDDSEISSTIKQYTDNKKVYDGFQNTLEISATLQNSAVLGSLLDKNAKFYQWNQETYDREKAKIENEKVRQTEVFLSFFIPERKLDDLAKPTTKWKLFLDFNGRRLEGKVTKLKSPLQEIQALYPHHSRWQSAYKVSFPVPTNLLDANASTLTVTGPVGSAQVNFPGTPLGQN
jgi:hypothetical protein